MIVDQHEVRVYSGSTELQAVENAGTITADRGWSPHVQGRITVAAPTDDALTAPGTLLTIELVQRFGDVGVVRDLTDRWCGPGRTLADLTAEVCGPGRTLADLTAELITANSWNMPVRPATGRTFYLLVTERTRKRGEHSLILQSIETYWVPALHLARDGNLEGVDLTIAAGSIASMVEAVVVSHNTLDPTEPGETLVPVATITYSDADVTVSSGASPWAALMDILSTLQLKLFCRGELSLLLTENDPDYPASIVVAYGENLIDWEITDDRQGDVMVRWTGKAGSPTSRPIYTNREGPVIITRPITRLVDVPSALPSWPPPGRVVVPGESPADRYAQRIGLDESPIKLRTINDYSVMPGSPITYTLPDESEETDSIDAITWQLGGRWEMDIWV